MTYGVMLGTKMEEDPPERFADGWYSYKAGKSGPRPDMNENADVIGFWIAVGASGECGVPCLDEDFQLDEMAMVPDYAKRITACESAWPKFADHARANGVALGPPRLWLVQTEVA